MDDGDSVELGVADGDAAAAIPEEINARAEVLYALRLPDH
jgi:hypothetical protein